MDKGVVGGREDKEREDTGADEGRILNPGVITDDEEDNPLNGDDDNDTGNNDDDDDDSDE